MDSIPTLIIVLALGIPVALAIWLIVRAVRAKDRIEALTRRLGTLERDIARMKQERESVHPVAPASGPQPISGAPPVVPVKPAVAQELCRALANSVRDRRAHSLRGDVLLPVLLQI